jgi:hypothetical protein
MWQSISEAKVLPYPTDTGDQDWFPRFLTIIIQHHLQFSKFILSPEEIQLAATSADAK